MALAGCGGGLPLLHPAQTLDPGDVRFSAGFSANVASGAFSDALRTALATPPPSPSGTQPEGATYVRGALVAASVAPGIAPWIAARVGLRRHEDAGLAYSGRSARVDARHAFDLSQHWALSLGVGGAAVLYGRQAGESLPGLDLGGLHGWAADAPLLVGFMSDGELYAVWLGARAGWEEVEGGHLAGGSPAAMVVAAPTSLSMTRLFAGGLLGLSVGFRHVHVAMEVAASYAHVRAVAGNTGVELSGVVLTPASSLWLDF